MRFLFAILLMLLLSFAASSFFPWWTIAIVCFFAALTFRLSSGKGFLAGFIAIFLLWLVVALIKDHANEQILSTRMAELFRLNDPYLFMVAGALVGGIVGGFAGWSGALIGRYLQK